MPSMSRSRLRVALVVDAFSVEQGGTSAHVQRLAAYLDERGHELLLVVAAGRPVLGTLTSGAFDVIHVHGPPWPDVPPPLLRAQTSAAIVTTAHPDESSPGGVDLEEEDERRAFAEIGARTEALYERAIARRGARA